MSNSHYKETGPVLPFKAVYCYYFPEVREVIDDVTRKYPHDVFLQSVNPGLDDFHHPIISTYEKHFSAELPGLKDFPYRYVSGGASESLLHLLAYIKTNFPDKPLYTLQGEYEGYSGYGQNLSLKFQTVRDLSELSNLPSGILFLSNPSARDGNIIPNEDILSVANCGHQIVYDATYVGLTDPYKFVVDHPNILAVVVSLSKPFGLYYYRIGFCFSRLDIKTLEVNKWFKNILSLIIAEQVLNRIDSLRLVRQYRPLQHSFVDKMNRSLNTSAQPSQVILLAHSTTPPLDQSLGIYNRGSNYRYCLTPYYLVHERGHI